VLGFLGNPVRQLCAGILTGAAFPIDSKHVIPFIINSESGAGRLQPLGRTHLQNHGFSPMTVAVVNDGDEERFWNAKCALRLFASLKMN
jgi:hypothetical protein